MTTGITNPTEKQVTESLHLHAVKEHEGWRFHSHGWHTDAVARTIVRFCLMLGAPINDVVTANIMGVVVDRLVSAETRIRALELARTVHHNRRPS